MSQNWTILYDRTFTKSNKFIESGRKIPNLYTLIKICDALKIRPEILFLPSDNEREKDRKEIIFLIKKYI